MSCEHSASGSSGRRVGLLLLHGGQITLPQPLPRLLVVGVAQALALKADGGAVVSPWAVLACGKGKGRTRGGGPGQLHASEQHAHKLLRMHRHRQWLQLLQHRLALLHGTGASPSSLPAKLLQEGARGLQAHREG